MSRVIACTPTKNRRWAWEFSKACMDAQIRKPDVWIVVDNSTDADKSWNVANYSPMLIYDDVKEEKPIGWLRNRCLELALKEGADYIVFWDDDDYYPPTRISAGVAALEANPAADISGSTTMHLLLTRENVLMKTGPFHDQHATAATMTIRRSYAETHQFDPTKTKGEELSFTDNWTAAIAQVNPDDCIVVMGHRHNTVNKSDLLANPAQYKATIVNSANGKMVVRMRWPLPWDLFRSTFSV